VPKREITVADANERIVTAFDARGWRDRGTTARTVARAASETVGIDPRALAGLASPTFLKSNLITRADMAAALTAAFRGVDRVVATAATPVGGVTVSNEFNIDTGGGSFVGNVGGSGSMSNVHVNQQQVQGDEAVRALVARYSDHPEVRAIVEAPESEEVRRSRLTEFFGGVKDWSSDVVAKVVTGLITGA
jgi:hypothetical protein